jgi:hypothetical protein
VSGQERILLDTNVVSEMRKNRRDTNVLRYLKTQDRSKIFLSCLTVGELWKGVEKRRRYDTAGAVSLASWVEGIEKMFVARILSIDVQTARLWGEWSAGRTRPVIDTLLAATAVRHGLTLVTRNTADMAELPVRMVNPWEG